MSGVVAVGIAIFTWWFATGVVMILARQGERHAGMVMALVTIAALGGLAALALTRDSLTAVSAYIGFFGALMLWAWHETAFLLGLVTGPRRVGLEQSPIEKSRFRAAFRTVRDHELALAATILFLGLLLGGAANQAGLWTFILLWGMRLSTKVNIFLGAPHAVNELLPHRLSYLETYFRTDRLSRVFWISLTGCTVVLLSLIGAAAWANSEYGQIVASLLAAFTGLALLEHLFLVLPVKDSALWHWAARLCPAKLEKTNKTANMPDKPEDSCPKTAGA
ncbi:putative photosynthetic complex assembly protein 2 [Roseibium hamelinense]|uniref:Putative photosynthetic complex assembly protein 2 n=1 Tax=Roseibium hamelinense TaxID=150831 RepID=A0A562SXH7_9HYPH|nr:putative photosynthetic complex assembly protein PuhE [Roseibium hamelinense]TWI85952.1 putative photosynthetic complex assembly protein 2 [Roseibium hamelinense]